MPIGFSLPSFAKINWKLRVLGKRHDGFHELFTVFQTVSLHDTISFVESDELTLTCDDAAVPVDERNLIYKTAIALLDWYGTEKGAAIHLEKKIPSPGGLGGGSSNAAVALIGLGRLWKIEVDMGALLQIAASIGSDVPFFIHGGTAVGTGRGELIEQAPDANEPFMLIVTPNAFVSTRDAFAAMNAATLTNGALNRILPVCRSEAESCDLHHSVLKNDFEVSVFDAYPEIKRVKETLLELGAVNAAMSGSGASVFAIFDKQETRQTAIKALDHESTWRKFAVATISRDQYREALSIKA
ncbi:MAG: 4-(cytidine 5'-diphospho)-2-C-methyl-D-erythritol kinase [Pyrinomonadaceae bacterium]|nr:4-(cytidine 5'-diphospho)-2-C-methyl-D-erythritol kinase [Acidobacteriota bacterium]MBP7376126.1 4-(cytidine 5'-diphospho)-2-C-methyl-D-erythritol kinase [Pyrinomonadaceae bacterium]